MVATTDIGSFAADEPAPKQSWRFDWTFLGCVFGATLMLGAAALSLHLSQLTLYITDQQQDAAARIAFAIGFVLPVIACWRRAIRDNQLAARIGAEPRYEHVSGWSALFLMLVVALIAALVWWASQSDDAERKIHAYWGEWVVIGLTIAFVAVAAAPLLPRATRALGLERASSTFNRVLNIPIDIIGNALSAIDGFLVFAVANAAGTNRQNIFIRYGLLLSVIGACAALGYLWRNSWAFIPLAWGFVVAFSISRRWAWIEQDRELAMLNSTISRSHIRVGFDQNLRDEALAAFLSMFLLVPLALRQAQIHFGDALFEIRPGTNLDSIRTWVDFYGTELAKAVPFVDWAEVYHVEGDAPVEANSALARHAVFLTRVLIDLVFLAALLQAISSASRDAQQKDLFYRKQTIHRLDPFTEPDALRALVQRNDSGDWIANPDKFDEFPRNYDSNRLVELAASKDARLSCAANLLLQRDDVQANPHYRLSQKAADKATKPEDILAILTEIEQQGSERNVYQLDLARRRLLSKTSMRAARRSIVIAMVDARPSIERTEALISVMVGERKEAMYQTRQLALDALAPFVGINLRVRAAVEQVASHDGAQALRARAAAVLAEHPDKPA